MTAAEKNDHYGMLNTRFDDRAGVLLGMGFKYVRCPENDTASFVRPAPYHPGRKDTVQTAFVMHADDLCWADRIDELAR
jgi:hypothetical protein